jgi:hypothetical protein
MYAIRRVASERMTLRDADRAPGFAAAWAYHYGLFFARSADYDCEPEENKTSKDAEEAEATDDSDYHEYRGETASSATTLPPLCWNQNNIAFLAGSYFWSLRDGAG